ncbi:MAG: ComEC family competence protein [Bacteroidetes bacterium]|nr:MAG: ComEC family competence protein [Bacteroidota bacterium]
MFYSITQPVVIVTFSITIIVSVVFFYIKLPYALRWLSGIAIGSMFYCLGILLHVQQNQLLQPTHFSYAKNATYYLVRIDEKPIQKKKSYKMRASVISYLNQQGGHHPTTGNILIYLANDSSSIIPQYGDVLLVEQNQVNLVLGPKNPEEFNYRRYLAFNHIHHQCYLKKATFTGKNNGNNLYKNILATQQYFTMVLKTYIAQPEAVAIMQALLYGYDDDIDEDTMSAYANTGTLHVLAVSGMHVGIIFYILNMLLFFMNKNKRLLFSKRVIIIASLWAYSALCGLSPSILRATVMFNFIIVAEMLNRKSSIYNTLAASCFSILCFDTNTLANVGFQLSYMAVLGIVFLQPLLYQKFIAQNWVVDQIWKITSVSIAAQVTTSPIGILYFHQFPNCFLFSNLLIIPLTTLILYGGIILLVVAKFTFIATWLGKAIMYVILFTNWLVKLVEQIPYSYVNGLQISISQSVILYLIFLVVMGYVFYRNKLFIQSALSLTILFFGINSFQYIKNAKQQHIVIYSIKRDNAIHIIRGNKSVLLIDSNLRTDKQRFRFHLQQHIWSVGIKQIDTVSLTSNWQLVEFNNSKILISSNKGATNQTNIDLLIVRDPIKFAILTQLNPKQVVLSGTLKKGYAKKLAAFCAQQHIPCHDVMSSGAFQMLYQ